MQHVQVEGVEAMQTCWCQRSGMDARWATVAAGLLATAAATAAMLLLAEAVLLLHMVVRVGAGPVNNPACMCPLDDMMNEQQQAEQQDGQAHPQQLLLVQLRLMLLNKGYLAGLQLAFCMKH